MRHFASYLIIRSMICAVSSLVPRVLAADIWTA
jgi:hypothetical protein